MDLSDLVKDVLSRAFSQEGRPLRLRFAGQAAAIFDGVLVPQRLEISEGVCASTVAHVTCLTTRADLPLAELMGLPIDIGLVTDRGELRRFNVVVTQVRQGQSDGALTTLQLTAGDIFSVMDGRRSNRLFLNKSAPDIARIVLDGWRQRFPALAQAFDYLFLAIDESRYPARALTFQAHQSDAEFLRMLFKRNGLAWFFRAGKDASAQPAQELVVFDDATQLAPNSAGAMRYHRRSATEEFDTLSLLAPVHTLVGGQVTRSSWDYKAARVNVASDVNAVDQGRVGNAIATALVDARIELPHAGDSVADHGRLTRLDMQRDEFRAKCLHGVGGVRAQAVCEWNRIDGHPLLDQVTPEEREYITVDLHQWCENSLPKELDERAQALLASSETSLRDWVPRSGAPGASAGAGNSQGHSPDTSQRYVNKFVAVRRDVPIVPTWDPQTDLPRMGVMTATVVGPPGAAVWCDELGRVKLSIHGLESADHAHASGAGTNGDDGDSAWVRVNFLWCGEGFGVIFPLRPGMEVILGFEHGDPSRPMVIGTRYNARQLPPQFDHMKGVPGQAALSGVVTRELGGERQQQLRFNDTGGNISVQVGTDHAATQLNLGAVSTAMDQGQTQPRGSGFELRTDQAGAIRSGEALLISTWKRLQAMGKVLAADEHQALLKDFADLFKGLGDYAAQHQGLATDTGPQAALAADIQAGTAPAISVTAPAGVAVTTPKTILSYAGVNIDSVALQHQQTTAGGYYVVNAGKGASIFAHAGGIQAVAHHGPLRLQSQHDDTQIDSANDLKVTAARKMLFIAEEITWMTTGGAFVSLKGGKVAIGGSEALDINTDGHNWGGPATLSGQLPAFGERDLGRTPRLLRPTDGQPAAGIRLKISPSEGGDLSGQTDASGTGAKTTSSRFQRLKNLFFVPRA